MSSLKDPTKSMKREEQDKKRSTKQGGGGVRETLQRGKGEVGVRGK